MAFTPLEIQFIRSSLGTKTDAEIALTLECDIDQVHAQINAITGGEALVRSERIQKEREAVMRQLQEKENKKKLQLEQKEQRRRQAEEKKKMNIQLKIKKQKEADEKRKRINIEEERQQQKKMRESRQRLQNRPLNLDQLISVRIDDRTHVFVKPGTDISKIKKQYYRNLQEQFKN